ncbi:MAG TPA: NTP transferase domain-containing protein [Gaiellaceae bacterium]|jgi:nicotine blue oxidoreductase
MVAAVVLAAGAATRYGSPKQWRFLPAVLDRLAASPVDRRVVVVWGAHPPASDKLSQAGVRLVEARDWELGPGASLRAGLRALPDEATHALVALADGPDLDPRAVERVLAHRNESAVVAASYGGVRGHPVCLARAVWDRVPDEGGRALEALLVPCDDYDPPGDVDFADLEGE